MANMLVQDKALQENDQSRGRFMATCLIANSACAAFGQVVSLLFRNSLGSEMGSTWAGFDIANMFLVAALAPALVVPIAFLLQEDDARPSDARTEIIKLVDCLAEPFVYGPIIAMAGIKFLMTDNGAAATLLLDGCGVSELDYTLMTLSNMLAAWITNVVYREYLFNWSFRFIYGVTVGAIVFSKMNDFIGVLVFGKTITGCAVYLGFDSMLSDWGSYTAIAVHSVLIVLMCQGQRGGKQNLLLNSMITAGWDLMMINTDYISEWFNVSTNTISDHEYAGYYKYQAVTIAISVASFLLLPLIPTTRESFFKTVEASRKTNSKSYFAAGLLLSWWGAAVVFTLLFAAFKNYFLS